MENVKKELQKTILEHESNNKKRQKKNNNKNLRNKLEKQIEKLQDLYFDDLINKDTYKFKYKKLNDDLSELNKAENEAESVEKDLKSMKIFLDTNFEDNYYDMNYSEKRTLWTSAIDRIEVQKNGELVIKFL
ncbi:Uncharacterised protein [Clostridioides difficile]|uniref:hypothetical protein n=1 Tax=Clostridioides difficile TaxID=1496 RepID=UPI00097FD4F8|nr:hypothetical protein [Clostridioides difficile]SJQ07591.1 Uncharacterised protein [Clostridioides difficile]